jgi:hypothetical protein
MPRHVRFPPDIDQIANITAGQRRVILGNRRTFEERLLLAKKRKSTLGTEISDSDPAKSFRWGFRVPLDIPALIG